MQMNFNGSNRPYDIINPEDIKGFRVVRSPVNNLKYNVYAVDEYGVLLVVIATDRSFEDATAMTQALNTSYDEVPLPLTYETVEVEMKDGSKRFYQVEV